MRSHSAKNVIAPLLTLGATLGTGRRDVSHSGHTKVILVVVLALLAKGIGYRARAIAVIIDPRAVRLHGTMLTGNRAPFDVVLIGSVTPPGFQSDAGQCIEQIRALGMGRLLVMIVPQRLLS